MKNLPWVVVLMVTIVILGCGGSGGGGTNSGTATATASATATATGTATGSDVFVTQLIAESSPGVQVDPTNLQVGDTVTFKLATIDETTHTYTAVNIGAYSTTDTKGAAGTFNTSTGVFTPTTPTNGTNYLISTVGRTPSYSTSYAVLPNEARISGTIIDSNQARVPFATVLFKDATGKQIGQTTATVTGTFNGSVPLSAARFNLLSTSFSATNYYAYFTYGTGTYGPLITTCNAPLPNGLAVGVTTPLPNTIILAAASGVGGVGNEPPPPPTCSP